MSIRITNPALLPPEHRGWIPEGVEWDTACLAYYEEVPCGILTLLTDDEHCQVTFHFVDPDFRQLDIGELLLERAIQEARKKGAGAIRATIPTGDRIAKLTYESQGFKATAIVVDKTI